MPLYDELWGMPEKQAIPGGSALNSARSTNFILKKQGLANKVIYFGSISNDEKGAFLEKVLADEGLEGNFHKEEGTPTGTCAVVVVKKERSLCANLAAACKYNIDHLHNNTQPWKTASIIYTTSFFLTSNPTALHEVAKYASDNDIPFGYNFSAVFLLQFELENVLKALVHADYLFANEDEAAAFAKTQNMEGQPLTEVAKVIAKWEKSNKKRPRYAIITHGAKPVIVAKNVPGSDDVELIEYPLEPLTPEQIVDTNGAGDAFVGGFLSQLHQGKDIPACIQAGIALSREVVQRSGCTFPENFSL